MALRGTPNLPDLATLMAAKIDPKKGLPLNFSCSGEKYKENVKKLLRISDEQDAVNRFTWYNLPDSLTGQMMERILYYKGQAAFFYMDSNKKFYFLPYSLDGTIDVYGRFMGITPLAFGDGTTENEKGKVKPWIDGLHFDVKYDVVLPEELTFKDFTESAVILHDYTPQRSQINIARQILQEGLIDIESDCIPFMRTALLNSTGIQGIKVTSPDEASSVNAANESVDQAAVEGRKYVAMQGTAEFQDLTGGQVMNAEEFLLAMQSLDNIRLGCLGLENGGIFEKKAHELQQEAAMASGVARTAAQDGLTLRQNFCTIVNSIWGLGIWCELAETTLGTDVNMDGQVSQTQSTNPTQTTTTTEDTTNE